MNWPLLQNSLLVASTTTALAVGFGFVAAVWAAGLAARWRTAFLALAIVAIALPPFLVTNCWIHLLGETGVLRPWVPFRIYSLGGTVWILSLMLWPITTFAVLSAWRRLEAAQFECEPALTGFALLRWLLLPAAHGELTLAAVLTFVLSLNNFAVPAILQTKVLPDEVWIRFNTQFDALGSLKLSVPLVIAPLVLLALFARRGVAWPRLSGTVPARVVRRQIGAVWFAASGVGVVLLGLLSVGAPLGQIACSKRTWVELRGAVDAGTSAIWNSFQFAALGAVVVIGLGLALSFRGGRREEARSLSAECRVRSGVSGQSLLTSAATIIGWLPFFLPGVLLGIALIWIFNRPVLAAFYQSAGIVVLALGARYFALGWTAARHALGSADPDLADAARLEGATRWQVWRHVLWPQTAPQLAAAWYVVYLLCLWDVESMVLIVPPGGETLALRIFNLLHYGHAGQVNALCLVLLGLAVLPLVVVAAFARTRQCVSTRPRREVGRVLTNAATCVLAVTLFASCTPTDSNKETALRSQFFTRAVTVGTRGVGIGEFNKPRSVAVDAQDNFYAVDMTGRVQKFSPEGEFLLSWQMPETVLGVAKGMGRDGDGNILVIEPHYQRVNHFTPDGRLVAQWTRRGTNDGEFMLPRAVAVNSRGEVIVAEYTGGERVQRFARPVSSLKSEVQSRAAVGTNPFAPSAVEREERPQSRTSSAAPSLLQVLGRAGMGPGEFNRAEGLAVDLQDRIYVADSCNHRIQVFASDGTFLRAYGKAGSSRGELSYPYDIAVDAQGHQFVCEFGNSRIQVFDADCQPVEIIGGPGAAPGRFANPWSIALDSRGNLYVADGLNHRVQKLVRRGDSRVPSPEFRVQCRPTAPTLPRTSHASR
jgi:ABC-type Fe3+ transport system permease subunit/DNA-binding beta-propeller fold protein YncE